MDVKIDGLAEFERRFKLMQEKVNEAISEQNVEDGEHIADEMRSAVAVETGLLKSTIRSNKIGQFKVKIAAGGPRTKNRKTKIFGGHKGARSYDYARAVEFGTVDMAAQPFFYNTVRRLKKWHEKQIQNKVKETIKEVNGEF